MKIYNLNINTHFNEENLNLTIGNFDGIHNGHQYVIDQLVKTSKTLHYKSCLLKCHHKYLNLITTQILHLTQKT